MPNYRMSFFRKDGDLTPIIVYPSVEYPGDKEALIEAARYADEFDHEAFFASETYITPRIASLPRRITRLGD